jgi:hypothetical protein
MFYFKNKSLLNPPKRQQRPVGIIKKLKAKQNGYVEF